MGMYSTLLAFGVILSAMEILISNTQMQQTDMWRPSRSLPNQEEETSEQANIGEQTDSKEDNPRAYLLTRKSNNNTEKKSAVTRKVQASLKEQSEINEKGHTCSLTLSV
jgi:hypothetical protein